jgi:hypothetical protein
MPGFHGVELVYDLVESIGADGGLCVLKALEGWGSEMGTVLSLGGMSNNQVASEAGSNQLVRHWEMMKIVALLKKNSTALPRNLENEDAE